MVSRKKEGTASRFTRFCDWDERPSRWRNYPGVAREPENRPENGSSHVLRGSGEKIAAGICFKSTDSGACRPLSVYTDSLELLYSGLFLAGRAFYGPGRSASECAQVPNRVGPQIAGEVSGNYPAWIQRV